MLRQTAQKDISSLIYAHAQTENPFCFEKVTLIFISINFNQL